MMVLRLLVVLCWSVIAIYMARGAWAAARGRRTRYGDPMRLACFVTAMLIVSFAVMGLVQGNTNAVRAGLYVLLSADAAFILSLGKVYGRGPLV